MSIITLIDLLESRVDFLRKDFLRRISLPALVDDMGLTPNLFIHDQGAMRSVTHMLSNWSTTAPEEQEKLLGLLANDVFDLIASSDPDPKKTNLQWIIRQLFRKSIRLEDLEGVTEVLVFFGEAKRRRALTTEQSQIQNYKSFADLRSVMRRLMPTPSGKVAPIEYDDEMAQQSRMLLDTEKYQVVQPTTPAACQWYGRDTEWCTAYGGEYSRNPDRTYYNYLNRGSLYIVLLKDTDEKFQFQFETDQFMDRDDRRIDVNRFWANNPELYDFFMKTRRVGPYDPRAQQPEEDAEVIGPWELAFTEVYTDETSKVQLVLTKGVARTAPETGDLHAIFSTQVSTTRSSSLMFDRSGDKLKIVSVNDWMGNFGKMAKDHPTATYQFLRKHNICVDWNVHASAGAAPLLRNLRDAGIHYSVEDERFMMFDEFAEQLQVPNLPPETILYHGEVPQLHAFWICMETETRNVLSELSVNLGDGAYVSMEYKTGSVDWVASVAPKLTSMVEGYTVSISHDDMSDQWSEETIAKLVETAPLLLTFEHLQTAKAYKQYLLKFTSNNPPTYDEHGNVVLVTFEGYQEDLVKEYGTKSAIEISGYLHGDRYEVNHSEPIDEDDFVALCNAMVKGRPDAQTEIEADVKKAAESGIINAEEFFDAIDFDMEDIPGDIDENEVLWYLNNHPITAEVFYACVANSDTDYSLRHFADQLGEYAAEKDIWETVEQAVSESNFIHTPAAPPTPENPKGTPSTYSLVLTPQQLVEWIADLYYTVEMKDSVDDLVSAWFENDEHKINVEYPYNGWDTYVHLNEKHYPKEFADAVDMFSQMDWFN